MTVYALRELPTINDPNLIKYCVCAQDMRRTVSDFLQNVTNQLAQHPVTTSIRVALAIMHRMAEGALSVELLCMKNRVRDAVILLLSLYELQLDLQYIALDLSRADIWIEHKPEDKKPWRVKLQLKEIYTDLNELDAEIHIYRMYSMVKHCNPAGESFVFPIATTKHTLQLDISDNNNPMIRIHMFGSGTYINRAGSAAAVIWASEGLDVGDFAERLCQQHKTLSKYNEQHLLSVLQEISKSESLDERGLKNGI